MNIKARIGAQLDGDLAAIIFEPIEARARRARQVIQSEMAAAMGDVRRAARVGGAGRGGAGGAGGGGPYRTPASEGITRDMERQVERAARERLRLERAAHREIERELERHNRERQRLTEKQEAEESRQLRRAQHIADAGALRVSGGAVRNFGGLVRRGAGVAADLARGAGVDFSLSGAVQARVDLEKRATDLSNAAYLEGDKGAAGKRQDPRAIMQEAQATANAAAIDAGQALEGLQAFVGKTGDLETGRAVMRDLAVLSRATGTSLEDMVSAAGDVSANLGDVPDKGNKVLAVMRAVAGQGKVGAVEMKDLSVQMAKLAASAPQFSGNVEDNMAKMGAFAQAARQMGGAASATQAATSVQGLINIFKTPARAKAFEAAGVKVFDKTTGLIRDPQKILEEALVKTKGDPVAFKKLFANTAGARAVEGFATLYRQAGGIKDPKAGLDAVRKQFELYQRASMGKGEIEASFNASMGTTEAQAQLLKNKVSQEFGDALEKVKPDLMRVGTEATKLAGAFASLVQWAAANPWQAVIAGFGASVMKSVGEEMMRGVTERMFGRFAGNIAIAGAANTGPLAPGGGGFVGGLRGANAAATAANTLGAAIAITAAAVTITEVGMLAINKVGEKVEKAKKDEFSDEMKGLNAETRLRHATEKRNALLAAKGGLYSQSDLAVEQEYQDARQEAEGQRAKLATRVDQGKKLAGRDTPGDNDYVTAGLNSLFGTDWFGGGQNLDQLAAARESAAKLDTLQSQLSRLEAVMAGELKVNVTNMPQQGPGVDGAGRTGP